MTLKNYTLKQQNIRSLSAILLALTLAIIAGSTLLFSNAPTVVTATPASSSRNLFVWNDSRQLPLDQVFQAKPLFHLDESFFAPTSVIVCKRVTSNGDAVNTEGGTFNLGVNVSPLGSLGFVNVNAFENDAAATCAAAILIPGGQTDLTVNETSTRPAGWAADAPGFPTWSITNASNTVLASGTGQTATLTGAGFSNAAGAITVTFTNQKARRLRVCKNIVDNGNAIPNQGANVDIRVTQGATTTTIQNLKGTEGAVGSDGVGLDCGAIPVLLGNANITFNEVVAGLNFFNAYTQAPGFAQYDLVDSLNVTVSSGLVSCFNNNLPCSGPSVALGGTGDLTLTIRNKVDVPRTLRLCKRVENSPGFSGSFGLYASSAVNGNLNIPTLTVADGQTVCLPLINIASALPSSGIGEITVPANFPGYAIGYPKWEMYADNGLNDSAGTPLSAGQNNGAGAFLSSASGEWTKLDYAQTGNVSAIKVVIVNQVGTFGNGADSSTGEIIRACKTVVDNGVDIPPAGPESASWNLTATQTSTVGQLYGFGVGIPLGATGTVIEGNQVCTRGLVTPSWMTNPIDFQENYAPTGWPGDAAGYPRTELRNAAGALTQNYNQMTFTPSVGGHFWTQSVTGTHYQTVENDYSFEYLNQAAQARTVQLCIRMEDNGLAPNTQKVTSATPFSIGSATEGNEVCNAPLIIPPVANPTFFWALSIDAPGWAMNSPRLEYTDSNQVGQTFNYSFAQLGVPSGGGIGGGPSNGAWIFTVGPNYYTNVPTPVFTGTTGNLKATWIAKAGPALRVCKQVLQNGDAVNDSNSFLLTSNNLGSNSGTVTTAQTLAAVEGGSIVCQSGVGVWNGDSTTYNGSEQIPANFGGGSSTPGYPKWEVRGSLIANPTGNPLGGLIASGTTNITSTLPRPASPESTGDVTVLFLNRAGPDRFIRLCKEVLADANPGLISGTFGFSGSLGGGNNGAVALSAQTVTATEGQPYTTTGNCSGQIDITQLDPTAVTIAINEMLPANWFASATGFPAWRVVDSANNTVASGTGAPTSAINLNAIPTANFDIVFSNKLQNQVQLAKSFSPTSFTSGGTTTLTFTVTNPAGNAATTVNFTDTLPSGLRVATPANVGGTCTNAAAATSTTSTSVTATNLNVPAGAASCTVIVSVTNASGQTNASCGANPAAFTNSSANISGTSINLVPVITPSCVVVTCPGFIFTPVAGALPAGTAGVPYSQTISQTNGVGTITWSISSGALPTGLSLNPSTGVISGTPTVTGNFSFTVGVVDANNCTGSAAYTLAINCPAITLTPAAGALTPGTAGVPYTQTISQSNAVGASTWSISSGALPTGLSLNPSTGVISGTPTVTGGFGFTVGVIDANNCTGSAAYTLAISCPTITIAPLTIPGAFRGTPYSQTFTQTGGIGAITWSISTGALPAGLSLDAGTGVVSGTPTVTGNFNVTVRATDANNCFDELAYVLPVNTLSLSLSDPLACTGPGNVINANATVTNSGGAALPSTFTVALPATLLGLPNTCVVSTGACTVTQTTVAWSGSLNANQTVTINYQAQVADGLLPGTQLCITATATVGGSIAGGVTACTTVNCPTAGPGLPLSSKSSLNDQKPGSVLIYNIYTSATDPTRQNTRIALTNTNQTLPVAVHLFFVDGASCSVADSYICLTANQTTTFLASDLDPGTTGYLIAIAVDANGCPTNFNYLIGDEYVKFQSGHAANLGAQAITAIAGGLPACTTTSSTAQLNFDGVSYNTVPHALAADNIPSRADGNDTLLILNRIGGNLGIGAATLSSLFGIFYDDAETSLSFSFSPGSCQFRSSISNNFPRLAPRFEQFVPAGRSGWFKVWMPGLFGMTGAVITFNANAGASAGAFNQGRNLHALTNTGTASYVIPVFPPAC